MIKQFITKEPLKTVIERAGANNVVFAVNYDPKTKRIHVEFHGSEEVNLVEVDMYDLKQLTGMFKRSIAAIEDYQNG